MGRRRPNGGNLNKNETTNDGSTKRSENHADPPNMAARGGTAMARGGTLSDEQNLLVACGSLDA